MAVAAGFMYDFTPFDLYFMRPKRVFKFPWSPLSPSPPRSRALVLPWAPQPSSPPPALLPQPPRAGGGTLRTESSRPSSRETPPTPSLPLALSHQQAIRGQHPEGGENSRLSGPKYPPLPQPPTWPPKAVDGGSSTDKEPPSGDGRGGGGGEGATAFSPVGGHAARPATGPLGADPPVGRGSAFPRRRGWSTSRSASATSAALWRGGQAQKQRKSVHTVRMRAAATRYANQNRVWGDARTVQLHEEKGNMERA